MDRIGSVRVGRGARTAIVGIINVSPESFYAESVRTSASGIAAVARKMQKDGADIIDIGAMSTAPYKKTLVREEIELRRMVAAVRAVRGASSLPISADTCRAGVAEAALDAGASIINDVTGLRHDPRMADLIGRYKPSLILCAYGGPKHVGGGLAADTASLLERSVGAACRAGAHKNQIAVDPAVGFFRSFSKSPFFTRVRSDHVKRDISMLDGLDRLGNRPVLVSVSRKSFLGFPLGPADPRGRLSGSLACELFAIRRGASIIRTHNVLESRRVADMGCG